MGLLKAVSNEVVLLSTALRTLGRVKALHADHSITTADMIENSVAKYPNKPAILFEGREVTYREYDEAADRYARWAQSQGLQQGDVVALLMENRPEYLMAWYGLAKVGVVTALINNNLVGQPLAHSLRVSGADHIVLGNELADSLSSAIDLLETRPKVWATGGQVQGAEDLDAALGAQTGDPVPRSAREGLTSDKNCLYIYTSGTTGNPKAANISHLRLQTMSHAFASVTNAKQSDRMYVVLPLYHSAGGICAVGNMLSVGGSIALKRKFSASQFWEDATKTKSTMFQYIGELCRYLLNAEPTKFERKHKIRVAVGNGLRPDIWEDFQNRFRIPKVMEFYGATEGNVALFNYDGTVGSVGRIPFYLKSQFNVEIVKFDVETEQPVRDANGFCIKCGPMEVGEAIGKIIDDPKKPTGRFEGYRGKEETEKKILRDVFEKGDAWFRTGDLMKQDRYGYFYFVDRIGDTFRWKGENVATSEVDEVISTYPGVLESNVYGVQIPGKDGRAGMASIVVDGNFDLDGLHGYLYDHLASYSRPVFVRLQDHIDVTGTFKHRKIDLVKEGFDPEKVPDPVYFDDQERGCYVALDQQLHQAILNGQVRL